LKVDDVSGLYRAEVFLETEKPKWIKSEDYKRIEEKAKAYISLDKKNKRTDYLSDALKRIVTLRPLKEKPKFLDDVDWKSLLDLENKISKIAIETMDERKKLDCEKKENEKLSKKIIHQLKIIDNMLNSPQSINKIEEYDNPFSKGNFENIQRVAAYLTELQQTK
jgi:hypothetical protein